MDATTAYEMPTDGQSISRAILHDLNIQVSEEDDICKLKMMPDLSLALWGKESSQRQYVPLHHAASRGKSLLLEFILAQRSPAGQVNIMNENDFTALRYAHRSELPHIVKILVDAGAVENYPALDIVCVRCREVFVSSSCQQERLVQRGYQLPKNCAAGGMAAAEVIKAHRGAPRRSLNKFETIKL